MLGLCVAVAMTGCAKKKTGFEQAGQDLDSALNQMSHDVDKTFNQK